MKKIYSVFISIIMSLTSLMSCDLTEPEVISENKYPQILINDIQTEMPGNIFITDKLIIIENPLSGDDFYSAYSRKECKLLGKFCRRGRSGIEFLQPNIFIRDTVATIYDLNGSKCVKYALNKNFEIIEKHSNEINSTISNFEAMCPINDHLFIGVNLLKKTNIMTLCNNTDTIYSFGNLPIKKEYSNSYSVNNGVIHFDSRDSILFFISNRIPYYEKYKFENGIFKFILSKEYKKYEFKINNGIITFDYDGLLISNTILTKNYIIQLRRTLSEHKKYLRQNVTGRNYNDLPQNLYLYDYNLNLIKIVKISIPILRLTGSVKTNDVYMINYLDGSFNVSKVEL